MGLIRAIVRIPLGLWLIIYVGYMYLQYNSWQSKSYKPLQIQLSSLIKEHDNFVARNKASERFEREKQDKLKEIQKLAEELNRALDKLPKSADIPIILSSFADISDRVGLEFSKFEPGQPTKSSNPFFMETPIKVKLKGTFVQIMSFLDEVSHLKRIIVSKGVDLKRENKERAKVSLDVDALFITYHFDESAR